MDESSKPEILQDANTSHNAIRLLSSNSVFSSMVSGIGCSKHSERTRQTKRYEALLSRYEEVKARLGEIAADKKARQVRRDKMLAFIETVRERDALLWQIR